jgi:hypothetical protein
VVVVVTGDELNVSGNSMTDNSGLVSFDSHNSIDNLVFKVGEVEVIVVEVLSGKSESISSGSEVETFEVGSKDELDVFSDNSGDLSQISDGTEDNDFLFNNGVRMSQLVLGTEVSNNKRLDSFNEFLNSVEGDGFSLTVGKFLEGFIDDLLDESVSFHDLDGNGLLVFLNVFKNGFGVFKTSQDFEDVGNGGTGFFRSAVLDFVVKSDEGRDEVRTVLLESVVQQLASVIVVFIFGEGGFSEDGSEGLSELLAFGEGGLEEFGNSEDGVSVLGIISEDETDELGLEGSLTGSEVLSSEGSDFSGTVLEFSVLLLGEFKFFSETGVELLSVESSGSESEDGD